MRVDFFKKRLGELDKEAHKISATATISNERLYSGKTFVNNEMLITWRAKVRNCLEALGGNDFSYLKEFNEKGKGSVGNTNSSVFIREYAIFKAVMQDYEGGYLYSLIGVIQADLFNDELEQATELLSLKYKIPAAVIAGVVLETHIRGICENRLIEIGKLDKMNSDLAKCGAYTNLFKSKSLP